MKKIIVVIMIVVCSAICIAQIQSVALWDKSKAWTEPGELRSAQNLWTALASVSSAGTEPSNLAGNERTYNTVNTIIGAAANGDDKIVTASITTDMVRGKFRCKGATENASAIWDIYLGNIGYIPTDCELEYAGRLTFTIGNQSSTDTGYLMADGISITESDHVLSWSSANPGSNRVAEARVDFDGADIIVVVPSSLTCNCILMWKGN